MNILVVGCGKVGAKLANTLCSMGHDVSIVDKDDDNFSLLDDNFDGYMVQGYPIDQEVLLKAGISQCDAVAAVTPNDNVNIMISQLAKEIFGVKNVIARIYDPSREIVFSHFGIRTICPTNLTVSSVCSALIKNADVSTMNFNLSSVEYSTVWMPKEYIGRTIDQIGDGDENDMFFGVMREDGHLVLAKTSSDIVLKESDKLIFAKIVN